MERRGAATTSLSRSALAPVQSSRNRQAHRLRVKSKEQSVKWQNYFFLLLYNVGFVVGIGKLVVWTGWVLVRVYMLACNTCIAGSLEEHCRAETNQWLASDPPWELVG